MQEKQNEIATGKKHTLKIDSNGSIFVSGVENVDSVCEKEAILAVNKQKLSIKGSGLNVNKLDVADGTLTLETKSISTITYLGAKGDRLNFKGLFR